MSLEQIGMWAGFVLTLMVFSYLLGDNFLYRIAVYVFAGLAAGYTAIVTYESVLLPWFNATLVTGLNTGNPINTVLGMLPVLIGVLLLLKSSPRLGRLGNLGIAFLVAVGAAVSVVGVISGTLIPLISATTNPSGALANDWVNTVLLALGVICALMYFHYQARRQPDGRTRRGPLIGGIAFVGQGVIVITLGAIYAAAILSSLTIFSERISYMLRFFGG